MAKPKAELRAWAILSGPSKYDFLEALYFRRYPTQKVKMKLQEAKGAKTEVREVFIRAVSKKSDNIGGDPREEEGHLWGFVGSIDWDGTKGTYSIPIVGEYSTKERVGRAEEISDKLDLLFREALFRQFPKTQP